MSSSANHGDNLNDEVIFSFVDGFVWASWPGANSRVRIGSYGIAINAMSDFLAQCELGERLANGTAQVGPFGAR